MLALLALVVLGGSNPAVAQPASSSGFKVSGLTATSHLNQWGQLVLIFQNTSSKEVTAYKLAATGLPARGQMQDVIWNLTQPAGGPSRLLPGGSISVDDPFGPLVRPLDVTVTAVVYDDNSSEGEPDFPDIMFTMRRYQALAIETVILPILGTDRKDTLQVAEDLRQAAARAEASRNLDEVNVASVVRNAVRSIERLTALPAEEAEKGLAAMRAEQTRLLEVLKTHFDPARAHYGSKDRR